MAIVAIILVVAITLWVVAVALKIGARQTGLLNKLIYGLGTALLFIVVLSILFFFISLKIIEYQQW